MRARAQHKITVKQNNRLVFIVRFAYFAFSFYWILFGNSFIHLRFLLTRILYLRQSMTQYEKFCAFVQGIRKFIYFVEDFVCFLKSNRWKRDVRISSEMVKIAIAVPKLDPKV